LDLAWICLLLLFGVFRTENFGPKFFDGLLAIVSGAGDKVPRFTALRKRVGASKNAKVKRALKVLVCGVTDPQRQSEHLRVLLTDPRL
jgi:hypothetical protein